MLDKNSDVSRLLDRLTTKGMISRQTCPNDKRASDVRITEKGLSLLEKIAKEFKEDQFISLSDNEAENLSRLLDKLRSTDL